MKMSSSSRNSVTQKSNGEIIKQGCLKKLKTNKKKYFVLRGETDESAACLEYYDSERKFKASEPPKRSITLKTCFNINKRTDTKHKWVIALHIKKDCLCVVFENESDMEEWLKALLELQLGESIPEGEPVRPNFEHVWCVTVLSKELGSKKNILGPYLLCLTDASLSLVKPTNDEPPIEFSLQKIRRCGHVDTFFYLELGQCTVTGPGNLWMQTEDNNIAENMHTTIFNACRTCNKKDPSHQPKPHRNRSSSANETSKPSSLSNRPHTGSMGTNTNSGNSTSGTASTLPANHQRTYSFPLSPVPPARRASTGTRPVPLVNRSITSHFWLSSRDRSDSMPSRNRTTSEGAHHFGHMSNIRPHSMYNNKTVSYSPPFNSSPVSPASVTYSTDSAGSSLSMDGDVTDSGHWEDTGGGGGGIGVGGSRFGPSHTPDEPVIIEENSDDYALWPGEDRKLNNYLQMEPSSFSLPIQSNTSLRKHSPNPSSSGFKSSSPSQGSGMDLYSPFDSSPLDTPGNYLPMSPGENRFLRNAVNHSRDSSLTEDGYVPMAPTDDGYVDMDHGANQNKQGSMGSITSGTPSTDIRFSEYPLDKVSTYFAPDEEEITPNNRPTRTYSVGSRPSPNINRAEFLSSHLPCERARAFSLGSRNVRNLGQIHPSSSHSSMEPCDDMMELDFSKKGRKARKKASSSERLSVPGGSASTLSSAASSYSTAEGSCYMEMSPPRRLIGKSPPKSSPPGHPSPSLSRVPEAGEYSKNPEPYMEMRPGDPKHIVARNTKVRIDSFPTSRSSPPIKPALLSGRNKDDYLDMSLKRKTSLTSLTEDNNNKVVAPQHDEYVEMSFAPKASHEDNSPPSDYMVMNMGNNKERRGSCRGDRSKPITIRHTKEQSPFPLTRKSSTGTPPIPNLLSLSGSPQWSRKAANNRREETGIFPFSPENEPSSKVPVDATSGELQIDTEDDRQDEGSPIDRFITGLGTMTIIGSKEDLRPTPTTTSPNGEQKELNYASLELAKSGSESEDSGRTVKTGGDSSSSPSPSLPTESSPFSYAQIDFAKSKSNH